MNKMIKLRAYLLSLVVLNLCISIFGCHPLIGRKKPPQEAVDKGFKFSIAGASSRMVATVVPPGNRAAPYIWDRVPNTDSYVQMLRPCNYYTNSMGVEPVAAERWWCWDRNEKILKQFKYTKDFETVVNEHPDWIWIIGNEPDHRWQDDLSPAEYAEFFGWIAKTITNTLRLTNPHAFPKLVFGQLTSPNKTDWFEAAYSHLKHLVNTGYWPDWPDGMAVKDAIYAISTHNYYISGMPCYGFMLEEERLSRKINDWKDSMNHFAHWASTVDGGALADKPLWITEYGVFAAFCHKKLEMRPGIDQIGGIGCPAEVNRGNGKQSDDYVFYGRNNREGVWGLQHKQVEYFVNPTNDPRNNQGDWEAAWWFISSMGDWNGDGECNGTAWLFGDNIDCTRNNDEISRAGETYRTTIDCLINGTNCPELYTSP